MTANIKEIDGPQFLPVADVELVKLAAMTIETDDHRHGYFLMRASLGCRSILNREPFVDIVQRYKSTDVPAKMTP